MCMKKYTFDAGRNRSKFLERIDDKDSAYRFLENMILLAVLAITIGLLLAAIGE